MAQINSYTDFAAYSADESRDATKSSVSLIESTNEVVYDGVNVVVSKPYAEIGDLVAFDTEAKKTVFVKGSTLNADVLPATLVPMAVVYARKGDKVLIVSLENAKYNGSESIFWAATYEVALSGFDLVSGGTFVINIGQEGSAEELSVTYDAGASLADIASLINASLKSGGSKNYSNIAYGGWSAAAENEIVVMSSNTYDNNFNKISVVSGCEITKPVEDIGYQTALTGVLIDGQNDNVRRNNGVMDPRAGCNAERTTQYYSANGSNSSGIKPGSSTIIRESAFTEESNPDLVAVYSTYSDYIMGEHMLLYPAVYSALIQDGRENTAKIGSMQFVDCRGGSSPRYPAAFAALSYGVSVDGETTGLEPGAWWLPSVEEGYLLMRDRVLTFAEIEIDPVNRTLSLLGKTTCFASVYQIATSCERASNTEFVVDATGCVASGSKCVYFSVRPVSCL